MNKANSPNILMSHIKYHHIHVFILQTTQIDRAGRLYFKNKLGVVKWLKTMADYVELNQIIDEYRPYGERNWGAVEDGKETKNG